MTIDVTHHGVKNCRAFGAFDAAGQDETELAELLEFTPQL